MRIAKYFGCLILLLVPIAAARAYPAMLVCALAPQSSHSTIQNELLASARSRIGEKFGVPQANPKVLFLNDPNSFWPLSVNEYGSTNFWGRQTCVILGPKGQTIDVVAHELMHAELAVHVGYWQRLIKIPAWFDEGLAMQVDLRERYALPDGAETAFVTEYFSFRNFNEADDDRLTSHYASAKAEVADTLKRIGSDSLYSRLRQIRQGESFDSVF